MIEGTLRYLGKRKSYIVSVCGHYFIFSKGFIHKQDKSNMDESFFQGKLFEVLPLETKYYFALDTEQGEANPVYTFTKIHKHIVGGQGDNVGHMDPLRFDGRDIKIHTFSIKEHTHFGRYPEIYPNEYVVGG